MSSGERKAYLALAPESQQQFQEDFWKHKAITADEYYRRLQYIDANFGSTKLASGANTDQGRVYLSLGAPNRVTRLPSSRIFVPLEIWYYESIPSVSPGTEVRLIFYQKNALGIPKLYSPTLDTIRSLLLPEAGTVGMFGPNENITDSSLRQNLNVGPTEDEVLTAAVSVAAGITFTGNEQILSQVMSPESLLNKPQSTHVNSRLMLQPKLTVLQTRASFEGTQVDLELRTELKEELKVQIKQGSVPVYASRLHVGFARAKPVQYLHRLDLLSGPYTVFITADERTYAYPLRVPDRPAPSGIIRVSREATVESRIKPFQFADSQLIPDDNGSIALVAVPHPEIVTWIVRHGLEVIWKKRSAGEQVSLCTLPLNELPKGSYELEAITSDGDYSTSLAIKQDAIDAPDTVAISYNANLSPSLRYAALGHQWLLRGNMSEARRVLQVSLRAGETEAADIELARIEALNGDLDQSRNRIRAVLTKNPNNFEALSTLAYIETKFQDYPVAAELYRRALAVQDSPALKLALSLLPTR
jgi:GWxTD domain-containing protein